MQSVGATLMNTQMYKPVSISCIEVPLVVPPEEFSLGTTYTFHIQSALVDNEGIPTSSSDGVVVANAEQFRIRTTSPPIVSSITVS